MKPNIRILVVAAPLLAACMDANTGIEAQNTPKMTTEELCKVVHLARHGTDTGKDAALAELKARQEFTPSEMTGIVRGFPSVGHSKTAGLCAFGYFYENLDFAASLNRVDAVFIIQSGPNPIKMYTTNNLVTRMEY